MTISPKLAATRSPVVVDIEAGERSLNTSIEYWKEAEQAIWHRWRPGAWQRVAISATDPDDPVLEHGYYNSPMLEPGWIYEVSVWARGVDPNHIPNIDIPPRALASLTVFAVRRRPEVRSFLHDETERTGGTYRQHYLVTTKPVFVRAAVGPNPPSLDSKDMLVLPDIVKETITTLPMASIDVLFEGLLPGNGYHEVVQLIDEFGNWEFVSRSFTTLKRHVSVQLSGIHIHDDSDDLSNGEATFTFELHTGNVDVPNSWVPRDQSNYSNGNIETGKAVAPPPNDILDVPYEVVQVGHRDARFKVSAIEDDEGPGVADLFDHAWGMKDLALPVGLNEQVKNRAGTLNAGPGLNNFQYDVSFSYSVDYA
jgi:hypothetical protein